MSGEAALGNRGVILLAIASAIVTANAYYIHPIIGPVADSFGVGDGLVGAVPALNQAALALGVLLLLPLGDRISNRRLVVLCIAAQVVALLVMALARDFRIFVAGSTLLGFFTITPYLLPAYASKRVDPARLGFVTAVLTTGVVAGVQLSRVTSGALGEYVGWRAVYWLAAGLMFTAMLVLPLLMDEEERAVDAEAAPYPDLLRSLRGLAMQNGPVMVSGLIQGLSFAQFLACWLGIGLYFTSEELDLGTDTVGYLALFSAIGLLTTPQLGKWADRLGAAKARLAMVLLQLVGVALLALVELRWWAILLPIVVLSIAGPLIDITGRMTTLSQPPAARTRLMSLYITLMFLGGGLGSGCGTYAYELGGWRGTLGLCLSLSVVICLLALWQQRVVLRRHAMVAVSAPSPRTGSDED